MKKRIVEGTINAFVTPHSGVDPNDLQTADGQKLVSHLSYSALEMKGTDWVKVGTVRMELTIDPKDEIVTDAVRGLRVQQQEIRAEAEKKATEIERRIQSLLAITFDPEVRA